MSRHARNESWAVGLVAAPFVAGLLWHRGSALWAVVSTVWGCWTRGVNC